MSVAARWRKRFVYYGSRPLQLPISLITRLPSFGFVRGTVGYQNQITFEMWFKHKIMDLAGSRAAYWPVHSTSQVYDADKILIGVDTAPGIMKGCYVQGRGGISIGDYTQVGPGVGIISGNHDVFDLRRHVPEKVDIGSYCWLGMGSKILPGVTLGDFTIVGAGAVVTRSFPDGYCVLAGNPARSIRDLDRDRCVRFEHPVRYHGYIAEPDFPEFRRRHLTV